jgi:hypothetical protein
MVTSKKNYNYQGVAIMWRQRIPKHRVSPFSECIFHMSSGRAPNKRNTYARPLTVTAFERRYYKPFHQNTKAPPWQRPIFLLDSVDDGVNLSNVE